MVRKKSNKVRIDFRKNHDSRTRDSDLTRRYEESEGELDTNRHERLSGKGDLTRKRTVIASDASEQNAGPFELEAGESDTLPGLVLRVHGLESVVRGEDGVVYRCAVRRVLKSMSTDDRHVVVAGDRIRFRREGVGQGMIQRVEPRKGTLSRTSKGRRHVMVANVDQLLIVVSAAYPSIKPNLIDRFLATADQNQVDATIVINKCDLVEPGSLQTLVGAYAQIGYPVVMVSATREWNLDLLRDLVLGKQSAVVGQSGVGKSSLLNRLDPGLQLRVQAVSQDNQKGKHTTTTSEVYPMQGGGAIIDTPGIRQFQLWDIAPEELTALFRDLRPYADHCRYPNCSHRHETDCAVKDAVGEGRLDVRRYESYLHVLEDPDNPD